MYSSFSIYNRNSQGQSVVTGISLSGEESPLFSTGSITQSRQALAAYKKNNGFQRIRQDTFLDQSWDAEVAPASALTKTAEAAVQLTNKQFKSPVSRFSANQRFDMMGEITEMVLTGGHRSMLVVGNGGTGKTYTILDVLKEQGLSPMEIDENDLAEIGDADLSNVYLKISGSISPMGLYRLLYENQNRVILFDDCDSVLTNTNSVNFLKAALDTTGDNEICWSSPMVQREGLPTSFIFKGKVIFISNKTKRQIPQPLLSRSLVIDMEMSSRDILDRAKYLNAKLLPRLSESQRQELFQFVEDNLYEFSEVTMRMFVLSSPFIEKGKANWKDLVLFTTA